MMRIFIIFILAVIPQCKNIFTLRLVGCHPSVWVFFYFMASSAGFLGRRMGGGFLLFGLGAGMFHLEILLSQKKKFFSEKYKKIFQGNFFCFSGLVLESALGHYSILY